MEFKVKETVQHDITGEKNKMEKFAEGATMHGFRYVFTSAYHIRRRLVWLIVLILMVVGFLTTFVNSLIQYYKYESVINIKAQMFHQLEIPSVSLCNANIAKLSVLSNFSQEYADSLIAVTGILGTLPIPFIPVPEVAKNISRTEFHDDFGYGIDELFVACNINGHVNCTEYVTKLADGRMYCYTFNSREVIKRKGNFNVSHAGYNYGITLFLDVAIQDYGHPLFLGEGLELAIHHPDTLAFTDGNAQFIAPGKEHFCAIKKKVVKRLSKPYSVVACIGDDENDMALNKHNLSGKYDTYSYSACINNCKLTSVTKCGCSLDGKALPMCSMYSFQTCALHQIAEFYESGEDCGCLPSCTNILYETQLTALNFPNALMKEFLPYLNWTVDSVDEMKKRYIQLHIYFDNLEVEEREQIPLMSLVQLFSNFGGQMGLYMGASIITLIEFFDMMISVFCEKYKKSKMQTVQEGGDHCKQIKTVTKTFVE